jgi:hypothetical protein
MHHAFVGARTQEISMTAEMLASVRDLNHRFLDLAGSRSQQWSASGRGAGAASLAGQVAPLSAAQRAAAAGCPYALFDLRFQDEVYWRMRVLQKPELQVADESRFDDDLVQFARLALFYAWHVAASAEIAAQLLLGMSRGTAAAFRCITVDSLPALAFSEASNVTARWSDCGAYWRALTGAACGADPKALRRVQLYGIQVAAAAAVPGP